jgi:hypothetical protein
MERLNEDAQWIVLMGFIISFSLFFLALIINQSTVVGQTTAESVLEFPKNDIKDLKYGIFRFSDSGLGGEVGMDFETLALTRKNAVVSFAVLPQSQTSICGNMTLINMHYSNGVTGYNETACY